MSVRLRTPASRPSSTIQARCTRRSTTLLIDSPMVVSGVTVTWWWVSGFFFPARFSQKERTGNSSSCRFSAAMPRKSDWDTVPTTRLLESRTGRALRSHTHLSSAVELKLDLRVHRVLISVWKALRAVSFADTVTMVCGAAANPSSSRVSLAVGATSSWVRWRRKYRTASDCEKSRCFDGASLRVPTRTLWTPWAKCPTTVERGAPGPTRNNSFDSGL
mmetsp:Transcript_2015/g.3834  ORF Transcript_2015/g.3834 Transcript_2015/m.3834 type:complete len:218 (-) Transcript_2015:353-1006(-)